MEQPAALTHANHEPIRREMLRRSWLTANLHRFPLQYRNELYKKKMHIMIFYLHNVIFKRDYLYVALFLRMKSILVIELFH